MLNITAENEGLDSDNGIYINGGTVVAGGNMYDAVDGGDQTYAVFQFAQRQSGGQTYTLKNGAGETVLEMTPANDFQYLVVSSPDLAEGDYTLWQGDTQLGGSTGSVGGPGGGMGRPDGAQPPQDGETPPELPDGETPAQGNAPDGQNGRPDNAPGEKPEGQPGENGGSDGQTPPEPPTDGQRPAGGPNGGMGGDDSANAAERSAVFAIQSGSNQFVNVGAVE